MHRCGLIRSPLFLTEATLPNNLASTMSDCTMLTRVSLKSCRKTDGREMLVYEQLRTIKVGLSSHDPALP